MPARASSAAASPSANRGAAEERVDDGLVLLGEHAAGRVDEAAAGLHERRGRGEDRGLLRASSATDASWWRHLRSGLRRSVPNPVHGASTSTRSILPARRLTFASRSCAMSCGCTFDSPERASRGLRFARRCVERVERVEAPLRAHQRAEQRASCRRRRRRNRRPCRALRRDQVADELAALVLHLDAPDVNSGCARAPGVRDAQAQRRVRRRLRGDAGRREREPRLVARRLERVDAQVERRAASHARVSASRSASP